jgi:phage anti-repressor protein
MKKTIIYRLDSIEDELFITKKNAYVFIEPLQNKKLWLIDCEDGVYSLNENEFEENEYYLSIEDAQKEIDCQKKIGEDYVCLCVDFALNLKKINRNNPFLTIAKYKMNKSILRFIEEIKDPIIKHYIKYHLALSDYISDFDKEIMEKTENL